MKRIFLRCVVLLLSLVSGATAPSATAQSAPVPSVVAGLVTRESPHSVPETVTRLEEALEVDGLTLVATVEHDLNAANADLALPPTRLLIFGNPQAGTPLLQEARTIGIDLPQKMLVWREAGTVWVAYNDPVFLAERHGLDPQGEGITGIAAVLERLAEAATAP